MREALRINGVIRETSLRVQTNLVLLASESGGDEGDGGLHGEKQVRGMRVNSNGSGSESGAAITAEGGETTPVGGHKNRRGKGASGLPSWSSPGAAP